MKNNLILIAFAAIFLLLVSGMENANAFPASDDGPSISLINVYPNAGTGDFYLTFSSADRSATVLEIMNADGKKVYSEELHSVPGTNFIEIKNSTLPAQGIYFVRLAQGKVKSYAERIVKK